MMITTTRAPNAAGHGLYDDDGQSVTSQDEALMEILGLRSTYLGDCQEDDETDCKDKTPMKLHQPHHPVVAPMSTVAFTVNQTVQKIKLPINVSRHFYSPEECLAIKFPHLLSLDECEGLISLGSATFDYIRQAVHTAPDGTQITVELQIPITINSLYFIMTSGSICCGGDCNPISPRTFWHPFFAEKVSPCPLD